MTITKILNKIKPSKSKSTVIYVHGARPIGSDSQLIQMIILQMYKLLNVVPNYSNTYPSWVNSLSNDGHDVIIFKWSGKIWPWQISRGANALATLVEERQEPVHVVSHSLGTWVAIQASLKTSRIKSITSVCGVYRQFDKKIPFTQIVSKSDRLERWGNFIANVGKTITSQNRIFIPHRRHDEFSNNFALPKRKFTHKRFSDLLLYLLKRSNG